MNIELTIISLEAEKEETPKKIVTRSKEITLGRFEDNDLVLDRPEISGKHARIRLGENELQNIPSLYLTDLSSSNGTFLENNRLGANVEVMVLPNERIRIGNYLIKPSLIEFDNEAPVTDDDIAVARDLLSLDVALNDLTGKTNAVSGDKAKDRPKTVKLANSKDKVLDDRVIIKTPTKNRDDSEFDNFLNGFNVDVKPLSTPKVNQDLLNIKPTFNGQAISEDDEEVEINFVAQKLYTISGVVLRQDKPLADVTIDAGPLGKIKTDQAGKFAFNAIPEKTEFALEASKDGFIFECKETQGKLKNNLEISITAKKLITVKGNVIRDGIPLEGVEIDAGPLGVTKTDKDGTYRFKNVIEGTPINISAKKDGFAIQTNS